MAKQWYSPEYKLKVLLAYETKNCTIRELCLKYKIAKTSLSKWIKQFRTDGIDGLHTSTSCKAYSKELKEAAVRDFLNGDYSQNEIIRMYEISSLSVLQRWINKYNSHRELKDTKKGRMASMTKGRKTTWEERIQIATDCLESGKDYQKTAEVYGISYQQVYQWVKKYEKDGAESLQDKRGRTKAESELSPDEKIKLQMQKLERENERLRAENLFFKKVRGDRKEAVISQVRLEEKYLAIQELQKEEGLAIYLLCEIAGIARSSYYKWLNRTPSTRESLNKEIIKEMKALHEKVDGIFGYRQMTLQMSRKFNKKLNHKRIYRLMKLSNLQSVIRRKKRQYKRSTPQHVTENVLNRDFKAEKPNEKWVTDVTEFKYDSSKKAYLSAIRDLYDGSIVSYVLGSSNNNDLVFQTFDQAKAFLNGEKPMIHSDRGFQYTSKEFKRKIDTAGMTQSMSRVGRCIDNGPMESFFGTLKCEKYFLQKFSTFEELSLAVEEYIDFYNHDRYQKRLNGLSPMEYRDKAA
ncbi:IS3 family transposase [Halalkalibacter alkaliphilus]|uniref:IS3 family transposase n=1 Tax=Halalkalibacter alkaliphilus TaxID=2917993 RepID=A0A9X2CU85_9BACI|nr:IS3 family transposase [Halalkalibacter alkaliphilus]MCL7748362.1 IS3 family transposase [Halalkalibacter alkaliphilus]